MNSIFTRRSVRSFTAKKVEADKIEIILKAGMQAPSAGNQQPWEFYVIEDKDKLFKLSEFSLYATPLKNATLGIVVLGNTDRLKFHDYLDQDLGACTQNILLEAVNQGLGAVWLGSKGSEREDFVRNFLNLDNNLVPFAIIALGYPKDDDANTFTDRFEKKWIHFDI